jgi:hypothetical protein
LGHLVLDAQLLLQGRHRPRGWRQRVLALDPGRDRVVGQLGPVAHPRAVNPLALQRAVGGDQHLGHHCQPLHVRVQRAEVGGKALGQQREIARRGVDRGGVVPGVAVDGCALFDQRIHVGHRDEDRHRPAVLRLAGGQLVQVPRVVVVQ